MWNGWPARALDGSIIDCVFDATETVDESGDGRSRTYLAKKLYQNKGEASPEKAKIEASSWHFVGKSADLIPSLSELRYSLGVDGTDGRPLWRTRSGGVG
jgi:hypothetical protein